MIHVLTYWEDGSRSKGIVARSRGGLEHVLRRVIEREKGEVRVLSYHVGYEVDEPPFIVDLQAQALYRDGLGQLAWQISFHMEYLRRNEQPLPAYLQPCTDKKHKNHFGHEPECSCGGKGYFLVGKTLEELYDAYEAACNRPRRA